MSTINPVTNGAEENSKSSAEQPQWLVEEVVAELPGGPPEHGSVSPVPFFHMLERLKTTKREGWRRFRISSGESISDHMYRMAIIIATATPPSLAAKVNVAHCTKMALVHDMAEALVGDITPVDGVSKPEKSRRESTTMDYFVKSLLGNVNGGTNGVEMKKIWQEYEDDETAEAHYVHDIDKIELLLQMIEYEKVFKREVDLGEFTYVASRVILPECQEWSNRIIQEREDFWGDVPHSSYNAAATQNKVSLQQKEEYYGKGDAPKTG